MSHSLLFYPNLSVMYMNFCKSGGKTQRWGNFLLSLAPVHHPAGWLAKLCPWQGTAITPGLSTRDQNLFGRSLCLVHSPVSSHRKSFPQPGGPVHVVSARQACSPHRCPAHCRPVNSAGCTSLRYRC